MAALTAQGAGANALYLGAELPVEDMLAAVEGADAAVLALSVVTISAAQATRAISAARGGLSDDVQLWVGGAGASEFDLPDAIEKIESLDSLEQRVALLGFDNAKVR